ncbi:MAG: 2'-5' RNA ligase [Chloroflexi bacterium RBG_16_52_11]|nr:MAG: 2'-5' RNA ligase [Chloroflexi bacterium RBG_16_52_11]
MNVIRAFIAIEMSPEIHARLEDVCTQVKDKLKGMPVRWVQVNKIHLTLKFLGEVSVSNLQVLKDSLNAETLGHLPFEISIGGLGAFPSYHRPRVIWVGIDAPQELYSLQRQIELEAEHLGYAREEQKFSPHLTLGRLVRHASTAEAHQVGEILEVIKVDSLGKVQVMGVSLYKSDLQPGGAVYTCLYTAHLK